MVARERQEALLRKAPVWRSSTIARAAACAVGTVLRVSIKLGEDGEQLDRR